MKCLLLLVSVCMGSLFGQTGTCNFTFNFTQGTGFATQPAPTAFDNRLRGCNSFTLNYQATGLSAVNVTLQSAGGAGTAGTFGTYSGSISTGSNPSTSTTGTQATFTGYVGWLRILVSGTPSGATWQIVGTVYGSQTGGSGGSTTVNACLVPGASSCFVQGADATGMGPTGNPVFVAGFNGAAITPLKTDLLGDPIPSNASFPGADAQSNTQQGPTGTTGARLFYPNLPYLFNSSTIDRAFTCNFSAIAILAPGTTGVIKLGTAAKTTRICSLHISTDTAANVVITSGTGTNCGTGTTNIDAFTNVTALAMDYSPLAPLLAANPADDVCYTFSISVSNASVVAKYALF